eukprot:TRINITY_DN8892_c0_g1_i1.p5 TRINITY_DN8892_c0_g1~~TRINITY_DN8892_c0_g1_i1.p5  ORF type:complete len:157 (+),score=32.07 TRINITY_DN8892_c0_g1_i1:175-645(+)
MCIRDRYQRRVHGVGAALCGVAPGFSGDVSVDTEHRHRFRRIAAEAHVPQVGFQRRFGMSRGFPVGPGVTQRFLWAAAQLCFEGAQATEIQVARGFVGDHQPGGFIQRRAGRVAQGGQRLQQARAKNGILRPVAVGQQAAQQLHARVVDGVRRGGR